MKRCSHCKIDQDDICFDRNRSTEDGLNYWCKTCRHQYRESRRIQVAAYNRRTYAAKRLSNLAAKKRYFRTAKGKFNQYRQGARRRGIPWSLAFDQFKAFWQRSCHYCSEDIRMIGLDRLDPLRGYEMGNVVSCCEMCNKMKRDYPIRMFVQQCARIAEHNQSVPNNPIKEEAQDGAE